MSQRASYHHRSVHGSHNNTHLHGNNYLNTSTYSTNSTTPGIPCHHPTSPGNAIFLVYSSNFILRIADSCLLFCLKKDPQMLSQVLHHQLLRPAYTTKEQTARVQQYQVSRHRKQTGHLMFRSRPIYCLWHPQVRHILALDITGELDWLLLKIAFWDRLGFTEENFKVRKLTEQ